MSIKSIVVVGGGAAGWITAGLIAARYVKGGPSAISVTLVESPTIGIIGVGEGTWPTMVDTLKKLGIPEAEFIQKCDASYKQASKFRQWTNGQTDDVYYHPFSMPQGFEEVSLASRWQEKHNDMPFAQAVGIQAELCDQKRAPKQIQSPEYATAENHGYHLDAGKFTKLLTEHCTKQLGVQHVLADVTDINGAENGDIRSLSLKQGGELAGDLFIDCSGMAALLIGKHYKVPFVCKKEVLFIDKALAVQVPYSEPDADIESATLSTAQKAGWIWDIGLPSRRGVGYVFSTAHSSIDDAKDELRNYLRPDVANVEELTFRELDIRPGHREKFWVNNCVAVGMSSGFLEPLEASALVMVEMAANTISLQLPASREAMDIVAKNYNEVFQFRWGRIIDFLKLHYVLSKREDSQFWIDNKKEDSVPESLRDLLTLWRYQPPSNNGFLSPYDLFPAASYQYILYGMGFETEPCHLDDVPSRVALADQHLKKAAERKAKIPSLLPSNRELIKGICAKGKAPVLNVDTPQSANCVPVALSAVSQLGKQVPLFFQRQKDTDTLGCVALLGLAAGENLTNIGNEQTSAIRTDETSSVLNTIEQMDLLEPVKLDIVFNDSSSVMIEGLHVFSQEKLAKLSAEGRQTLEQSKLLPIIRDMLDSLAHVPTLIERKNQLLGTKRATALG